MFGRSRSHDENLNDYTAPGPRASKADANRESGALDGFERTCRRGEDDRFVVLKNIPSLVRPASQSSGHCRHNHL